MSLASRNGRSLFIAFPPFRVCLHGVVPPLAQADLPPKHGDHQNDGEAAEHPQVLDHEEDHLGGGVGRVLGYAVHLRELWGGHRKHIHVVDNTGWFPSVSQLVLYMFNYTGSLSLSFHESSSLSQPRVTSVKITSLSRRQGVHRRNSPCLPGQCTGTFLQQWQRSRQGQRCFRS